MSTTPELTVKKMKLRYAGACRACGVDLPAGEQAMYDRTHKAVTCLPCHAPVASAPGSPPVDPPRASAGTAGASARREHERRVARRQAKVRAAHPHVGGLILALRDDPQTTTAWAVGARGEELLAKRLDTLTTSGVRMLHDRRIPGSKANIDHIAVAPSGVFVIDAKRYRGRPRLQVDGGLFRPRTEKLMVAGRDCTKLVAGIRGQVHLVQLALAGSYAEVGVHGMLCFIEADWPLFGGAFSIDGFAVVSPAKAADRLVTAGPSPAEQVRSVHRRLAEVFPEA